VTIAPYTLKSVVSTPDVRFWTCRKNLILEPYDG
jgi:hypothetical protein